MRGNSNLKRLRPSSSGEGGELWVTSYADMMSFLAIFFILFFNLNQGKASHEVALSIAESFKSDKSKIKAKEEIFFPAEMRDPDLAQLVLRKTQTDLELLLPGALLFPSGSEELSGAARKHLKRVAEVASKVENLSEVAILGHTDSVPPGRNSIYQNNWTLSAARAGQVAYQLIQYGIDPKLIVTSGMADKQPLMPEWDKHGQPIRENRAKNRRVHIVLRTIKKTH